MPEMEEGRSEVEFTDIITAAESLGSSVIFHVVMDILGFVLFMHQQIPSILQDINIEFDALHTEYKDLEIILAQTEMKASLRREHAGRKRELRMGIRKFDKLMKTVGSLQTALQLVIGEIPNIKGVMLVLGASSVRPQHVFELCFSHGKVVSGGASDFSKCRAAEWLSRKAIRDLISKGAGSNSSGGPTKLFLFVKAPNSFSQPMHFLPRRDYRYNKKILPFRLRFKSRVQDQEMDSPHHGSQTASCVDLIDPASNDLICVCLSGVPSALDVVSVQGVYRFQCRHVIRGMACRTSPAEE